MLSTAPRSTLALAALVATISACGSDNPGPRPAGDVGIAFRLAQSSSTSSLMASSRAGDGTGGGDGADDLNTTASAEADGDPTPQGYLITRGEDEILVTRAQVVLKNVKIRRAAGRCTDDDDDRGPSGKGRHDDGCPTVHIGPYLVDMSVNGTEGSRLSVNLPEGAYTGLRFDIHKVTSNRGDDLAFRQANPDFRDISVRLEGTYNGTPFTFISDVNARLDVPLPEPLTIDADVDNVTVSIDMASWFVNPSGGLYAPALANTPGMVRARVENNIRKAFKAFRDKNRDGRKD